MLRAARFILNIVFFLQALLLFLFLFEDRLSLPVWLQVGGRLHPAIMHLPIGGLIFALAVANLSLDWTPVKIAYLPLVFASAVAFYGALFVFGATLSFWTTEALEIVNIFTYGGTTMASYPMNIYTDWLRRIWTWF